MSFPPSSKGSCIDGHEYHEEKPSSSMKLFGFSVPRNDDDDQYNKINGGAMMMKSKKKKMTMMMKPPLSWFKCEFCGQGFANSQALGGHQNAHKAERRLLKLNPSLHYHQQNNYFVSPRNNNNNNNNNNTNNNNIISGKLIGTRAPARAMAARPYNYHRQWMTGETESSYGKDHNIYNEVINMDYEAHLDLDLELRLGAPVTPHNE